MRRARGAPLLDGLPPNLASPADSGKGSYGRFVRVELPGRKRTLTLAEVASAAWKSLDGTARATTSSTVEVKGKGPMEIFLFEEFTDG